MERFKIYSAICTPDGTILESKHTHDFNYYLDKNGEEYMIDGGLDYMRTNVNIKKAMDLSIYSDEPHELVRCFVERGGRGKDGTEPLKFALLKDIDDDWLKAIIDYEEEKRPNNKYLPIYKEELKWRKIG